MIGPDEVRRAAPVPAVHQGADALLPDRAPTRCATSGEPVAVVVAADRYVAEDAAELVAVEYEPLDVVVDTREALEPDAPLLHDEAGHATSPPTARSRSARSTAPSTRAAHVVNGEYYFPRYSSMPMECYGVIADVAGGPTGPGHRLGQLPRAVHDGAGDGRRARPPDLRGAAARARPTSAAASASSPGIYPYIVLMALACKHAGRRCAGPRTASSTCSPARPAPTGRCASRPRSTATGWSPRCASDLVDNVGAYLRPPEPSTLYRCFGNITGAYHIGAVEIRARAVVTNKAPTGPQPRLRRPAALLRARAADRRGRGATGLDAVEVRRRNLRHATFPHETPTGGIYDCGDYHRGARAGPGQRRATTSCARGRTTPVPRARTTASASALIVDPSGTNIGYVGLATPSEERKPGRDKSGSTEHVRVSRRHAGRGHRAARLDAAGPGPRHGGPRRSRPSASGSRSSRCARRRDGHRDAPRGR